MAIINGNDLSETLFGTDDADTINAKGGHDIVIGKKGDDIALLGTGNDVFRWFPGDGSDTVDGEVGTDTLDFVGANVDENIQIFANAGKAIFFRDIAAVTMTLDNVERIDFDALGGSDLITLNNLAGTEVKHVAIDLAGVLNGTTGDGVQDNVIVNGAAAGAADVITLSQTGTGTAATVVVNGLAAQTTIAHFDAGDHLVVNGLGGNDRLDARALPQSMVLVLDGGAGDDTLIGSAGADLLLGGAGNDVVIGARGDDTAFLGAGNDTFFWAPGEGSDTVEGGPGIDTLAFLGAGAAETVDILANFGRTTFFRDIASINMDLNDVDRIQFDALGGADKVRVHDLTGTEITHVDIDLAATVGGTAGDGAVDSVSVEGTAGADGVVLWNSGTTVGVDGLQQRVLIQHLEGTDLLTVDGGGGNDVINAFAVGAGRVSLTLSGGAGDDKLVGSAGADVLIGGAGADRFVIAAPSYSPVGPKADKIVDFSHAQGDKIDLSSIDANMWVAGNQAFHFIGTGLFTHAAGELRYAYTSPTTTTVAGDINGDGASDFHIVLAGNVALTATDFVL
ncbi:Ca2+-binding RTX toxin-like protein [Inquilinus ginsengisoli]|uniref:calcium-binding protein n=1 Tax=Inquilinus ginsengisoli TaxID=363840 RepID=UPI003D23E6D2